MTSLTSAMPLRAQSGACPRPDGHDWYGEADWADREDRAIRADRQRRVLGLAWPSRPVLRWHRISV